MARAAVFRRSVVTCHRRLGAAALGRVIIPPGPDIVSTVASSGTTQTIPDVTTSTISDITFTATCALTFPAASTGQSFTLVLRQDGTGSRTVTWPPVQWAAAVAPTLTPTVGAVDVITFLSVAGTWYGFTAGMDMR